MSQVFVYIYCLATQYQVVKYVGKKLFDYKL